MLPRCLKLRGKSKRTSHAIPRRKTSAWYTRKHHVSVLEEMRGRSRAYLVSSNAPPFSRVLSEIIGIENLRLAPELRGGGARAVDRGGYPKLHAGFNGHRGL